jgi:hypothetical protein
MVCLPHNTIATSSSSHHCQTEAGPQPTCRCSLPVGIKAGESVVGCHRSPLVATKDTLLITLLRDNNEHEYEEQPCTDSSIWRDGDKFIYDHLNKKLTTQRLCETNNDALKLLVKKKIKRRTVCDEFDKFSQNAFKQN